MNKLPPKRIKKRYTFTLTDEEVEILKNQAKIQKRNLSELTGFAIRKTWEK